MLPSNVDIQKMIRKEASKGMAVAELEYLGLSLKVINALENRMGIVYIRQLANKSKEDILEVSQLGLAAVKQILKAFERFPELDKEQKRWHKGSDKIEYYKSKI